jgi:periplasmic divalent cation tolerance protein
METKKAGDAPEVCVICSTVPPSRSSDLAGRLLAKDLAACINIVPVRSLYRWKGEACNEEEHLLIIKTRQSLADRVIRSLRAMHPYEVPEIIMLPVTGGHLPYLEWVHGETQGP